MVTRLLVALVATVALAALTSTALADKDDAAGDTHSGLVVSAGEGKLTMTDKDGKNEHTHDVAADARITRDGKEGTLNDLKKGDAITVQVAKKGDKEQVIRVEAKSKNK